MTTPTTPAASPGVFERVRWFLTTDAPRVKAIRAALALLAVVLIVLSYIRPWESAVTDIPATLTVNEGVVKVMLPGSGQKWEDAINGMSLPAGSKVRTASSGRATVKYFDGSITRVDVDSAIEVLEAGKAMLGGGQRAEVLQTLGRTWHRVEKLVGGNGAYKVKTPTAVAAVRGTEFIVEVYPGGATSFVLFEGSITIQPEGVDEPITLEPGQRVRIRPGPDGSVIVDPIEDVGDEVPDDWDEWNAQDSGDGVAGDDSGSGSEESSGTAGVGSSEDTGTVGSAEESGTGDPEPDPDADSDPDPATTTDPVVNSAPVFGEVRDYSVSEGAEVAFNLHASDANGDTLRFSATGLPTGATLNRATGAFFWAPELDQLGSHTITFYVTDGIANDSMSVTFDVSDNKAPVMTSVADISVWAGETVSFDLAASDPDGDPLEFSCDGLPPGAIFDSATGVFRWVTTADFVGATTLRVWVSDGDLEATQVITITVLAPA